MSVSAENFNASNARYDGMLRLIIAIAIVIMAVLLWFSNVYFTSKFTESARIDAAVRSTLYAGNISSAMERQSIVPLILSRDAELISALNSRDYTNTSQRLISFQEELDVAAVLLLDLDGRVVASSDRRRLGAVVQDAGFYSTALRQTGTTFSAVPISEDSPGFYFSHKLEAGGDSLGVIVVMADLTRLEERWRRSFRQVFVSDSEDNVLMSSNPLWKNKHVHEFISETSSAEPGFRVLNFGIKPRNQAFTYVDGTALLRVETKVGFQGWKLSYFETLEGVRARVNGILAFEIMVFAILTAFGFYMTSRASARDTDRFKRESAELRSLNRRLQEEISERKKAEKNLEVAEQSLQQQSKLAALGQMSAAVAHELNQPLAAMRTYVAGSRLLMKRGRADEATSSFQRIDDLLDRMGALTRQLKSFARKSDDDLGDIDLRDPMRQAISMMQPQLGTMDIKFTHSMPDETVPVLADALRLEQIIVNLMRNALDAMKGIEKPHLDLLLTLGEDVATLSVRDNGSGIDDPDNLFEPFYTTKLPGEGLGLGLAISAGIASDLGGSLTARNRDQGGATFELQLPRAGAQPLAAAQ